jgi:hypothetical protein
MKRHLTKALLTPVNPFAVSMGPLKGALIQAGKALRVCFGLWLVK